LVDPDDAPWDVEMDEMVACPVEVYPLGREIAGEQETDRAINLAELLYHVLLLGIREARVERHNGRRLEA
jgi:hypothetical protein